MDSKTYNDLKQLQAEMAEYANYLKHFTYNPYAQIEDYSNRLEKILKTNKYE